MKKELKLSELLDLIPEKSNGELKYEEWTKFDPADFKSIKLIGSLDDQADKPTPLDTNISYWSKDYPISFSHYPNNKADVYSDGTNYYLLYDEYGGHIPERRCRLIQNHLIITDVQDDVISKPSDSSPLTFLPQFSTDIDYITDFEEKCQITVPNDYVKFLLQNGGGVPDKCNYYKELDSGGVFDFEISAFYGKSDQLALDLLSCHVTLKGIIPQGFLCISDDGIGNYVAIGMEAEKRNKIFILMDEEEEFITNVQLLEHSLNDFIQRLK